MGTGDGEERDCFFLLALINRKRGRGGAKA